MPLGRMHGGQLIEPSECFRAQGPSARDVTFVACNLSHHDKHKDRLMASRRDARDRLHLFDGDARSRGIAGPIVGPRDAC